MTDTDITILYQDDHIIAIDKPAGYIVHTDGRDKYPTVTQWFIARYPDAIDVGEEPIVANDGSVITRPGVVHRLDKDTSGVLLLAKTDAGHECLKAQFQNRTIKKHYHVIVYGLLKQDEYTVKAPIGRSKQFGRWTAIPTSIRGTARDAETVVKVVRRIADGGDGHTIVDTYPATGRTHQIRVHMQYLNHPVVADPVYAGKRNRPDNNLGCERQALHAREISFVTVEGESVTVTADLPAMFTMQG